MIVGSGLLASASRSQFEKNDKVCVFAAGVSDSSCTSPEEFSRDRLRLISSLTSAADADAFFYFGTCSVHDPEVRHTHYVQHKLAMERLVSRHPNFVILRLPQLAGRTENPHTLLNYLRARISCGERFSLWKNAYRNIIDVEDVIKLLGAVNRNPTLRRCTLSLANPNNSSMPEIVRTMERVVGKAAVCTMLERGCNYKIIVTGMLSILSDTDVSFEGDYLYRALRKYYG